MQFWQMQTSSNIYTCMVFQGGSNTLAWYPAVERYISSEQMQVASIGFICSPIGIVIDDHGLSGGLHCHQTNHSVEWFS